MKAVRFEQYGGIDVLVVVEVDTPTPGAGQVLVRVAAAGINPGEASIREGYLDAMWPAAFPSGQGSDLAGTVEAVGGRVTDFSVGDEVLGFTDERASHAEYVVADQDHLVARPADVPWEQAGSLHVVGATAMAAVRAVGLADGDVVVVSGAAGGVGSVTVQLARRIGATVIGLAGEANHGWLRDQGVVPVDYHGDDLRHRILGAAGGTVDAVIDTFGSGYVALAVEFGVAAGRIDTIIDFAAAQEYGVKTEGNTEGATAENFSELAGMISRGELTIPIAASYPLAEVQAAYRQLEQRHTRGKIVLKP